MDALLKEAERKLEPATPQALFVWDDRLPGYGVKARMTAAGPRATYILKYRDGFGKQHWYPLGIHGALTPDQAWDEVRKVHGRDPVATDAAAREAEAAKEPVRAIAKRFFEHLDRLVAANERVETTPIKYRRLFDRHVAKPLGDRAACDLKRADVQRLLDTLAETPTQANRTLAMLSSMLAWAHVEPNPVRGVRRFRERRRERTLTLAEYKRLRDAIPAMHRDGKLTPHLAGFFLLLMYTGARPGELLRLRWDEVDLERGRLWIKDTKTREQDPRVRIGVVIAALAAGVLGELAKWKVSGNPYVFPGAHKGKHMVDYDEAWSDVLARAKIAVVEHVKPNGRKYSDVTPYVLRHSLASFAATIVPLKVVGGMLGHKNVATSARYAHDLAEPVERAAIAAVALITSKPEVAAKRRRRNR